MDDQEPLGRDYVLHERLGEGAVAVVRRATRNDGGAQFAAKLLRPEYAADRRIRDLFLREEAALRQLRHESIAALEDLVFERGQLVLLMEYVDGGDLRGYLADRGGTLPPADAGAIGAQVAAALAAAHAQGVVHLDLKPENILVELGYRPPTVKISDFGIAALLVDAGRDLASAGGTPGYIAPELRSGGAPTAAADVYALGVVLAELVTGTRPAAGSDLPTGLPGPLASLVAECLRTDPRDRPSARAVAARLREAGPGLTGAVTDARASNDGGPVTTGASEDRLVTPPGQREPTRLRATTDASGGAAPTDPQPATAAGAGAGAGADRSKRRRTLVVLLAGLATALVLVPLVAYAASRVGQRQASPADSPSATASATVSAAASVSAPQAGGVTTPPAAVKLTYAGRVTGGGASLAIAVHDSRAIAYLCDGNRVEAWLQGTAANGRLELTGANQASLSGTFDPEAAAGSATAAGRRFTWRIPVTSPPSGLYRTAATVSNAEIVGGWIVLADGTQVGVVTTAGEPAPAPKLDVATRTATVNGATLTAQPIDGATGSGFAG